MKYIHRKKRIYLNQKKTKYCTVRLYKTKAGMQADLEQRLSGIMRYEKCLGMHHAYERLFIPKRGRSKLLPETGTVYLCLEYCGAGVVSHELLHAVLWAWRHKRGKKQYPITIKNMKDEEEILHNHTDAVNAFYNWYWIVVKELKKSK